jgi:hypothetical protein
VEEAHVYGFAENMSLHCLHHGCASCKRVSLGLHVNLSVQGQKFEGVMVPGAIGGSARASINRAARADLISAVLQLISLRDTFRKSGCGARDIPDKPMNLIICRVIVTGFQVMHVQDEGYRAGARVRPAYCW